MNKWRRTKLGWFAYVDGLRLSVTRYRRGSGIGFTYVARVNESARTSPAEAHQTLAAAKRDAESLAVTIRDNATVQLGVDSQRIRA